MQIAVKTLTGNTMRFDVQPTTKIAVVPSIPRFTLCGADGITAEKIRLVKQLTSVGKGCS